MNEQSRLSFEKGIQASEEGRFQEAVLELREAARLYSGDAEIHFFLGYALSCLGDVENAISAYREAINLKPMAAYYEKLAIVLAESGKIDEAIHGFKEALSLDPDK